MIKVEFDRDLRYGSGGNVMVTVRHCADIRVLSEEREFEKLITEITAWLQDNRLGFRTAYDQFRLNNEQAYTMFMLRWS
jgi:hypothetical protein